MSMKDEELFPLSWLTQFGYCPRRCGLLAIDQAWAENEYTASGRQQHKRVHTSRVEKRGIYIELYELPVFSKTLGVSGKCDCVEAWEDPGGVSLPYGMGQYRLYPVEYKHGIVRDEQEYHIQLCAQAICLEEQFQCKIPTGAIFFVNAHRRDEIQIDDELRKQTCALARDVKKMLRSETIPPAVYSAKCKKCSMQDYCNPKIQQSAARYCSRLWNDILKE